jgi:SapC
MTRSVLLNNLDHRDLRIVTTRGAAWGDDVMSTLVFPAEFRSVQAHYPIVFQKTADGTGFQPVALFGFEEGQNLFLGPRGWDAHYVPMAMERQPFLIGRSGDDLLVNIDLDSPRVSTTQGEPVFLDHGGPTEFLERMNSLLLAIHEGVQESPSLVNALLAHDLLESFVLDFELADGSQHRLAGLYTIDEERLGALGAQALQQLNAAGHLLAIYMVLASASHLRDLIERRNRRLPQLA